MEKIKQEQLYALDRIGIFLSKLEFSTNPLDIEAQVYTIMRTAESVYNRMHTLNAGGDLPCRSE